MEPLYRISSHLADVLDSIDNDGELPEDLALQLDALFTDFETKCSQILRALRAYESQADVFDAEATRLVRLRRLFQRRADWLKQYLLDNMVRAGTHKTMTDIGTLSICMNSRPAIILSPGAIIPPDYERVTRALNTELAYQHWRQGIELPAGLVVQLGHHLRIR